MGDVTVILMKHIGEGKRASAWLRLPAPPTVGSQVTIRPGGERYTILSVSFDSKLQGYFAETEDINEELPDHKLYQDEWKAYLDRLTSAGWTVNYYGLYELGVLFDPDAV